MTRNQMRTITPLILIAALFCIPVSLGANPVDDPSVLMEAANKAYMADSHLEAIMLYEQIRDAGWESPYLYYNLGNAYFRTGAIGPSILNYERALRLNPRDNAIRHNLSLARQKTLDQVDPMPVLFIWQWRESFISWLHADAWAILMIITLFMVCLSLIGMILARAPLIKKVLFASALVCMLLTTLCWYAANRQYYLNHVRETAIVMAQRTTAKSSPGDQGVDLFAVHEGLKVYIVSSIGEWVEVKLENGRMGWLPKKALEII